MRRYRGLWLLTLLLAGCGSADEPTTFRQMLAQVSDAPAEERGPIIEAYIARQGGTPLIERQSRAIFLVQQREGVVPRILGDFNGFGNGPTGPDATLGVPIPIAGTDWAYHEASVYTNARAEYVLDYGGTLLADPRNPRQALALTAPRSEIRMPQWIAQPELDDAAAVPSGTVVAEEVRSRYLAGTRRVWFYTPPGYEQSQTWYPVLYVLDGATWIEKMQAPQVLDRLIARGAIPPVIAVFVEPGERSEEFSRNANWRAFMSVELVAVVDRRFRTLPAPDQRLIMGAGLPAYGAVDLAVEYPGVFALCAALAPPVQTRTVITNQSKGATAVRAVKFFVLSGTYDGDALGGRRLRTALDLGTGAVTYLEVPEGRNPDGFRGHLDDAISTLITPPAS